MYCTRLMSGGAEMKLTSEYTLMVHSITFMTESLRSVRKRKAGMIQILDLGSSKVGVPTY